MQNHRDHIQAYHFAVARLTTALTSGAPGTGETPFRRSSLGVLIGTVLAALICGAMLLLGLLDPAASTAWRQPGAIVVEKETGTRYLYLNGELRPTINYASAALVAGSSAAITYVPESVLAHVPTGPAIGIPGAPDSLPAASALLPGKWAVCVNPARQGAVTLMLGPVSGVGRQLDGQRIVVRGPSGDLYLVWENVEYPLSDPSAIIALGLGNTEPFSVPSAWLAALPAGPALIPPAVPGIGKPGGEVGGRATKIGDLFVSQAAGVGQYYVVLADGLAPISRTELALISARPGARPPVPISPADIAAAKGSSDRSMLTILPDLMAGQVYRPGPAGQTELCVRQSSPGTPAGGTLVSHAASGNGNGSVLVPPGTGMIVLPGRGSTLPYLITDTGMKYPLVSANAVMALGYNRAPAQVVPSQILGLLPTGPALEVGAARRVVTWPP